MKDLLFDPICINQLEIANRIYLPAMHLAMARDYEITDQILQFYARRAKGGPGMICTGYATVNELSGNTTNIGAHDDRFLPGLTRLADIIRENHSLSAVQLNHAGRYNFSFFIDGRQPVAPSAVASRMTRETPRALETDEIRETIDAFAAAASRVKQAGFDAVEILSGTGYLISEFLSPLTNQRTDKYGGSLDNRMRFGLEVADAVRQAVGPDFPLIVRMNGNDFMPGGNDRSDLIAYARALSGGPADALCINVGWHEARVPQIVAQVPRGAFGYLAREIRAAVDVPVIASHRISDPATARQMIGQGVCDMVAMGRSLIADPDLPLKAKTGREHEIVHCIACGQGCFDNLFSLKHVECMCNPLAGHEYQVQIEKTAAPKKVMVVGGGAAGMTAAVWARRRGHEVTLYEQSGRLGGQLHLAAAPPGRQEFARLSTDLEQQISDLKISVVLNCGVDRELLASEQPDTVILATGAVPLVPPIPGAELDHVINAWDVLGDKAVTGQNVVIVGGGAVGVETALFLAEQGTMPAETLKFLLVNQAEPMETLYEMATRGSKRICLVEMTYRMGNGIGKSTKWGMMQDLKRLGVAQVTGAKVVRITRSGLEIEQDGKTIEYPADTIVMAAGSKSHNPLQQMVTSLGIDCHTVGDAFDVGTAFDAVHAGFKAGCTV